MLLNLDHLKWCCFLIVSAVCVCVRVRVGLCVCIVCFRVNVPCDPMQKQGRKMARFWWAYWCGWGVPHGGAAGKLVCLAWIVSKSV